MKKILTLFFLLAAFCFGAQAETYIWYVVSKKSEVQNPEGFFTFSSTHSLNDKYACKYNGTNYGGGLKMETATEIYFSTNAASTLTIVQSTTNNGTNTFKLDDTEVATTTGTEVSDENNENIRVYVIKDLAPGDHKITKGSGESGIVYISVEITGAALTILSNPTITATEAGVVTIAQAEDADVYYTTDGTIPSETNGNKYEEPFTVEKTGTTVKAIAWGNGTTTLNSAVVSEVVFIAGQALEAPTFKTFNGTVGIYTTIATATIEYSLDNTNWSVYTKPFTLLEDATVYAKVSVDSYASEVAQADVEAVAAPAGCTQVILSGDLFDCSTKPLAIGMAGTAAEGYQLAIEIDSKSYTDQGTATIDGVTYHTLKLSNGAKNTLTIPEGVDVKRVRLYSVVNGDPSTDSWWNEFNDTFYKNKSEIVCFGSNDGANPDLTVFAVDSPSKITFTNKGVQLFFLVVLDVAPAAQDVTLPAQGFCSFAPAADVVVPADVQAWVLADNGDIKDGVMTLTEVKGGYITAGTGVILTGEAGTYSFENTTDSFTATASCLVGTGAEGADLEKDAAYILGEKEGNPCFYLSNAGHIGAYKAYLPVSNVTKAPALRINFGGDATGIESVEVENTVNGAAYNVLGQKVNDSYKGFVIKNGKKAIVK